MKKISGATFYFKKVFPTIWFGFLALFVIGSITSGASEASVMFLVVPVIMAIFGFVLMKHLVWGLVDEVIDHGSSLEFRKGGKVQNVPLNEILNVNYTQLSSPERIVVQVRNAGPLGNELSFSLPIRLFPFSKNPTARELIERIDDAKRT